MIEKKQVDWVPMKNPGPVSHEALMISANVQAPQVDVSLPRAIWIKKRWI